MTIDVKRTVAWVSAGLLLLAVMGVWREYLATRWTQRVPPGWSWRSEYVGFQTNADPATGQLPAKDTTAMYTRRMSVKSDLNRPSSILLEDSFIIHDLMTGALVWKYVSDADVDPLTGAHTRPEFAGDYLLFPRNVERRTYRLRYGYVTGVPMAFEREETVEDMQTYLFAYRGRGEYTASYIGNPGMPGLTVKPGQEVRCADDQFILRMWVEPITGETLKVEESCYSNDYLYETTTGKQLKVVDRFAGETAGDDVVARAAWIRRQRLTYLLAQRYVPGALGLLAIVCLVIPFVGLRLKRRAVASEAYAA